MAADMLAACLAPLCPSTVDGPSSGCEDGGDAMELSFGSSFVLQTHRVVIAARCPLVDLPPPPAIRHRVDGLATECAEAFLVAIRWVYTARVVGSVLPDIAAQATTIVQAFGCRDAHAFQTALVTVALPGNGSLGSDFATWYEAAAVTSAVVLLCDGAAAAASEAAASTAAATAAAAAVGGRGPVAVGDTVVLSGLQSRPELNGCFGTVVRKASADGRWGVRLRADIAAHATGRKVRLLSLAGGNLASQEYALLQAQAASAAEAAASAAAASAAAAGCPPERVPLGSSLLVKRHSQYFASMLSGPWAEGGGSGAATAQAVPITVAWDPAAIKKLVAFIHGAGEYVVSIDDLQSAAQVGGYFGVQALLASAHVWIAEHLTVETAPDLWCFVTSDPDMSSISNDGCYGCSADRCGSGQGGGGGSRSKRYAGDCSLNWLSNTTDADVALFDFHIKHFAELSQYGEDDTVPLQPAPTAADEAAEGAAEGAADGGGTREAVSSIRLLVGPEKRNVQLPPPMHELEADLMHRLLLSGLVSVGTKELMGIVRRYAKARALRGDGTFGDLCRRLSPPCVIFNRETRGMLLGEYHADSITARTFM